MVLWCRKSSGFSRGASIYRGVTRWILHLIFHLKLCVCPFACSWLSIFFFMQSCRHHQHGRWQARIGRVAGNKDLYLGTFSEYTFCLHCVWPALQISLAVLICVDASWIDNASSWLIEMQSFCDAKLNDHHIHPFPNEHDLCTRTVTNRLTGRACDFFSFLKMKFK